MRPLDALLGVAFAAGLAACGGAVEDIEPGATPPKDSAEAGFWMVSEKAERKLVTSGKLAEDAALQDYVHDVTCRVAQAYCEDIRVYVVEQPDFNAAMFPNGFMVVWTGLLLRAQNEAQLATVLGHEVAHYQRRHTLQRWRDIRATTGALAAFGVATAMAGVGVLGDIGQLVALGHILAFSRDQEREADDVGFRLMVEAEYAPGEAPNIWSGLIDEREAGDVDEPPAFFASHPPAEERFETLTRMAQEAGAGPEPDVGDDRHLRMTLPHRGEWLEEELRRRRFERMQVVLDRLFETGTGLGELHYYQGELYRRRGDDGDAERALAAYETALAHEAAPPANYRSIGLVRWNRGETAAARDAFERYLAEAPRAEDRAMIRAYVEELQ